MKRKIAIFMACTRQVRESDCICNTASHKTGSVSRTLSHPRAPLYVLKDPLKLPFLITTEKQETVSVVIDARAMMHLLKEAERAIMVLSEKMYLDCYIYDDNYSYVENLRETDT